MTRKTRQQLVEELTRSHAELRRLLESVAPVQDWQREPAEWSFRYIAAHLATAERAFHLARLMLIASGREPRLAGYNQHGLRMARCDLHESLAQWTLARQELLAFIATLNEADLSLTGIHADIGVITLLDALDEVARQDRGHIRHVRQLIRDFYEDQRPAVPCYEGPFVLN